MTKIELYLESGEKASLEDVCKWWIETYPPDVFVNKPELIVEIRGCLKHLLRMMHKPEVNQSHNNQQNKPCEVSGNSSQPPNLKRSGILATFL